MSSVAPVRIVWFGVLAVLAGLASVYEVDRAARRTAVYASFVPNGMGGFAIAQRTAALLNSPGVPAKAALDTARDLVIRRPVPAENLSLLAIAAYRAGENKLSSAALAAAATRGWRDPMAQLGVFEAAVAAEDWAVAAQRLDALRRTNQADTVTDAPLTALAGSPAGRAALARQLAEASSWRAYFLRRGREVLPQEQFADVVGRVMAAGGNFECTELAEATRRLLISGQRNAVQQVWRGACRKRFGDEAVDRKFNAEALSAQSPFNWVYPDEPGLRRSVEADGTISFANSDVLRRVLGQRTMLLTPGRYGVAVKPAPGPMLARVEVRITCTKVGEAGRRATLPIDASGKVVIHPGCPVQIVEVLAGSGEGVLHALDIRRLD